MSPPSSHGTVASSTTDATVWVVEQQHARSVVSVLLRSLGDLLYTLKGITVIVS